MMEYQDQSLRGRVFQRLREDILNGKYKENDELREISIGDELGVSRTPVREALRQLELEGLVRIVPNKGAYVTGITRKDVADIFKIRSMLEGLSEFRLKKEQSSIAEQVSELDGRFHRVLYEASDSRILEHVLTDFHKYVKLARKTSVGEEHRAEKSIQEHRAILEAIKQKDADKAEELANQHIKNVMQNLHLEE